jgi:GNAT superfamily N-acetyltransferase
MGLSSCLDQAVHFAEKIQFFRWIWTTETRGWNHREEQWYNTCAAYRRYHVFIEDIIPKGQLPKFDWQIDIIGEEGAGATTAIKSASLKPEFRHRYFQSKNLIKGDFIDLQYKPLESKDLYINDVIWSNDLVITETNLDFFKVNSSRLLEGQIIVDPDEYPDHIRHGEHRYFLAMKDNKLVGLSAMTLHKSEDGTSYRIYHRAAYVIPDFRRQGIWRAMMKYKIKYMLDHGWNKTFPIHTVSVSDKDSRYRRDSWTLYKSGVVQEYTNPDGSVNVIDRLIYISNWSNIKKQYLDRDV